jgi:hypothetical protein
VNICERDNEISLATGTLSLLMSKLVVLSVLIASAAGTNHFVDIPCS